MYFKISRTRMLNLKTRKTKNCFSFNVSLRCQDFERFKDKGPNKKDIVCVCVCVCVCVHVCMCVCVFVCVLLFKFFIRADIKMVLGLHFDICLYICKYLYKELAVRNIDIVQCIFFSYNHRKPTQYHQA